MTPYTMRRARPGELDVVMGVINERIAWLKERGERQWSTMAFPPRMADSINNAETWLLWDSSDGRAVATVTISTVGPPDFWTPDELADPALYLSKIATRVDCAGRGLGRLIVDWANSYALSRGISILRWDVWRSNQALQAYWSTVRARHVRTVDKPPWNTGALFEYAFHAASGTVSELVTTDAPFGTVAAVTSRRVALPAGEPDEHADDPAPPHLHVIDELLTPPLGRPDAAEPKPLSVSASSAPVLLYDAGDGWRAHRSFPQAVASWPGLSRLRSGHPYHLRHEDLNAADECRVVLAGDLDVALADCAL